MHYYQITEIEDNSDKESVLESSMESFCMDDSITENRKNESGIPHSLRHTMSGFRIAAAGLAGVLLAGNTTGLISASQVPDQGIRCVSGIADIAKDDSANALCGIWWGNDNRQQDGENPDGGYS